MKTENALELASALFGLAKRYPKRDWQIIIQWLETGRLTSLLKELSEVSAEKSNSKPPAKKRRTPDADRLIAEVELVDSGKGALLQSLHKVLQDPARFPHVAAIHRYGDMVDINIPRSYGKRQAIHNFISQAARLPNEQIENILEQHIDMPGDSVDEFRRLSNLIRRRRD